MSFSYTKLSPDHYILFLGALATILFIFAPIVPFDLISFKAFIWAGVVGFHALNVHFISSKIIRLSAPSSKTRNLKISSNVSVILAGLLVYSFHTPWYFLTYFGLVGVEIIRATIAARLLLKIEGLKKGEGNLSALLITILAIMWLWVGFWSLQMRLNKLKDRAN